MLSEKRNAESLIRPWGTFGGPYNFFMGATLSTTDSRVLAWLDQWRVGRRLAFAHGPFDVLGVREVRALQSARSVTGSLVVGLYSDAEVARRLGPTRPIHPLHHRAALLAGLACVDLVLTSADDPSLLIQRLRPQHVVDLN